MSEASLILLAVIDEQIMERHAPASPAAVGIELAHRVQEVVANQELGYFPALEYFREREEMDTDLLSVFDSLVWLGEQLIQSELRARLRSVFAQLNSMEIRHQAHALPSIRPGKTNTANELAAHYTPNRFKIDIEGILTPRMRTANLESAVLFALRDSFQRLECIHSERHA